MAEKPTYEALEKRVAELEQQLDPHNSAAIPNPPELLSALMEAFRYIPLCTTFEDAAKAIFDQCKRFTGARSGYVALLTEKGDQNEVLYLDPGGLPCDVDPDLPMPIRGLRETAYQTGQVAYDNRFSESPWTKYLPDGHVTLDNVLFSPLTIEDKTVGVIGIANKPGGFNQSDVYIAGVLGDLAAIALTYARAEESLRKNEHRYRTLFIHNPNPIAVIDRTGRYLDANDAFTHFVETPRETLLTMTVFDFSPPGGKTRQEIEHRPAWEKGGMLETEYLIHGKIKILELSLTPVAYKGIDAVIGVGKDITEQKRTENALRENETRYRDILKSAMDGFWLTDTDGRLLEVNEAYCRMSGYSESELLNMRIPEIEASETQNKRVLKSSYLRLAKQF